VSLDHDAFLAAAHDIAAERGDFAMFLLVLREEMTHVMSTSSTDPVAPMRWDVLLSAPWLAADQRAPLEYVAQKIERHGGKRTLRSIARLGALPISHPIVKRVMQEFGLPRPLNSPATVAGVGGVHMLDPRIIGPGIVQAIVVAATRNPKLKKN
jgi:hypothetical protein